MTEKEEMIMLTDNWFEGNLLTALKTLLNAKTWCIKKNRKKNVSRILRDLPILLELIDEKEDHTNDPAYTAEFLHHANFLYTVGAGG